MAKKHKLAHASRTNSSQNNLNSRGHNTIYKGTWPVDRLLVRKEARDQSSTRIKRHAQNKPYINQRLLLLPSILSVPCSYNIYTLLLGLLGFCSEFWYFLLSLLFGGVVSIESISNIME
jgi:hypothetical protein